MTKIDNVEVESEHGFQDKIRELLRGLTIFCLNLNSHESTCNFNMYIVSSYHVRNQFHNFK